MADDNTERKERQVGEARKPLSESIGYYEIPMQKLNDGLRDCAKNIRRFVKDVDVLLKSASDWHAIALSIFACEELGKYRALLEAKRATSGDTVKVSKLLFGFGGRDSHIYKMRLGQELLPPAALTLVPSFRIQQVNTERFVLSKRIEVTAPMRLDCLFVDWNPDKADWEFGGPISPHNLRSFVEAIIAALNELETS